MSRTHQVNGYNGVSLHVSDIGSENDRSIILLHGWSQCRLAFDRQTKLADQFRIILPDLRGHGQSDNLWMPNATIQVVHGRKIFMRLSSTSS